LKTRRGRRRPADAELLLSQVKEEFGKRKDELGAKKAAKQLGVKPSSFYKYVKGDTLPDMDVLRRANDRWNIKWRHLDFSEILPKQKVRSPKQLVFSFLEMLRTEDIEIVEVGPKAQNILQVTLNIRFSA
jgi:hypothetical protein